MSDLTQIENLKLRSEFLRAINLVTTTQLTLFLESEAPTRDSMIASLEKRLADKEPSAGADMDIHQSKAMREVLFDAISVFNDPFATYINPDQLKRYYNRRKGNLLGVGLKFRAFDDDYPVVIGTLLGGPLEKTPMSPADRIIEINGKDQKGVSSRDVTSALKGEAGSEVELRLRHEDDSEYSLTATRSQINLKYARSEMLADKVGYLKVSRFGGNTHKTARALLQGLLDDGARHLVLDLRDNPGGSTRAARGIVSSFVDKQNVYCERYEAGGVRELPHEGGKLTDLPLAVIVNEASQSASEIVAGALQDYDRAVIVGAPTYGKGLIQKVFNLQAPLGGAVRTTIAAYATPKHTLIHGVGVTPDIYEATAPESLFRETGSLNVSADARAFKRKLLEQRINEQFDDEKADSLIAREDLQLKRSIDALLS